ncbi:hypothetical protein FQA39_LY04314 [Lamprigera yunnana]|nr:hypothetical protein FQA39_LY04314 [Lamprigera yunnana]
MSSMTIKVREGVNAFLDKAKSRSVPLALGPITTFDANSREGNVVDQSTNLPWSIRKNYSMNDEARLRTYGSVLQEALINSTRYDLNNKDARCNARLNKNNVLLNVYEWEKFMEFESYMMYQFFYDSTEIQKVFDQSSEDDLSIQNMSKTEDITEDVKILYYWEYSEGLSSPMMLTIATAASDPLRNEDTFMNIVTLQRDYRSCTLLLTFVGTLNLLWCSIKKSEI